VTSKTRSTLLALNAWPESRPLTRTLREHWEDATAKKPNDVHEWWMGGELVMRFRIEPPPVEVSEYECRMVIDDRPHSQTKSAAEVRAWMLAGEP
jgi:hypothetical protein